jgi:glycosyltransferase involved in cell wall biosynthesis
MSPSNKPLFSIITVTFNAERTLESTIKSIFRQTYTNFEFIIVDGKSTDGTVEVIKKHKTGITKWISEPDQGLYDAMNKGMQLATGDYIWFMNAGDEIYGSDTLELISAMNTGEDIYYGEMMLVDANGKEIGLRSKMTSQKLPAKLNWKSMRKGMAVGHQSFIIKKSAAPEFDITYRFSADIDWIIKCLRNSKTVVNTGLILSKFLSNQVLGKFHAGGESKKHLYNSLKERFQIHRKHFGLITTTFFHLYIILKAGVFYIRRTVSG